MPRIATLCFTKDYHTVADAFKSMVKNPTVTEREEYGHQVIEVEGDFQHFVPEDMDMWGGYLKFTIKDNTISSDGDREARAIIADGEPGFAEVLFSPTIGFVYRRVEMMKRTTIITQRIMNGTVFSGSERVRESKPWYEWEEMTREFGQKVTIDR